MAKAIILSFPRSASWRRKSRSLDPRFREDDKLNPTFKKQNLKTVSALLPKKKISLNLILVLTFLLLSVLWLSTPTDVSEILQAGDVAAANKNYQAAFAEYKKAALLNHFDPEPHFRLSSLYQLTNNWEAAAAELALAAEFSTDSARLEMIGNRIINTLEEPKKIEEQILSWRKVVKEKPDYRDAWVQLAAAHYQLYQFPPAKAAIDQALNLDPNFEPAKKLKALIP